MAKDDHQPARSQGVDDRIVCDARSSDVRNAMQQRVGANFGVVGGHLGATPRAGALVVLRPSVQLLAFVAAWKVATEMLFPLAGFPAWEFIERGGSYAAPIALAMVLGHIDRQVVNTRGDV